jgi:hypothetical protein
VHQSYARAWGNKVGRTMMILEYVPNQRTQITEKDTKKRKHGQAPWSITKETKSKAIKAGISPNKDP